MAVNYMRTRAVPANMMEIAFNPYGRGLWNTIEALRTPIKYSASTQFGVRVFRAQRFYPLFG